MTKAALAVARADLDRCGFAVAFPKCVLAAGISGCCKNTKCKVGRWLLSSEICSGLLLAVILNVLCPLLAH